MKMQRTKSRCVAGLYTSALHRSMIRSIRFMCKGQRGKFYDCACQRIATTKRRCLCHKKPQLDAISRACERRLMNTACERDAPEKGTRHQSTLLDDNRIRTITTLQPEGIHEVNRQLVVHIAELRMFGQARMSEKRLVARPPALVQGAVMERRTTGRHIGCEEFPPLMKKRLHVSGCPMPDARIQWKHIDSVNQCCAEMEGHEECKCETEPPQPRPNRGWRIGQLLHRRTS